MTGGSVSDRLKCPIAMSGTGLEISDDTSATSAANFKLFFCRGRLDDEHEMDLVQLCRLPYAQQVFFLDIHLNMFLHMHLCPLFINRLRFLLDIGLYHLHTWITLQPGEHNYPVARHVDFYGCALLQSCKTSQISWRYISI